MAILIAAKSDLFEERLRSRASKAQLYGRYGTVRDYSHVRRPFRGTVLKQDTYATLEVVEVDGTPIPLLNAGARESEAQVEAILREQALEGAFIGAMERSGNRTEILNEVFEGGADVGKSLTEIVPKSLVAAETQTFFKNLEKRDNPQVAGFLSGQSYSLRYSNFLLQSVRESRQEKFQILETFGIPYIFFYGERPLIYEFTGTLLNSADFQWRAEFWANYEEVIRGTRLVERRARTLLTWDDILVEGYILQASAQDDAMNPQMIQFTFQMFITQYRSLAPLGDANFPTPIAVSIDTTYWQNNQFAQQQAANPSPTNVDAMRRRNLQAAAASPSLISVMAETLSNLREYRALASAQLFEYTKSVELAMTGREIRVPAGANPLLYELQENPELGAQFDALSVSGTPASRSPLPLQISEQTKSLIRNFLDGSGRPTFFIQDKTLIADMTRRYNEQGGRQIRILPLESTVVPARVGLKIRDNIDEYIEQTVEISQAPEVRESEPPLTDDDINIVVGQMLDSFQKNKIVVTPGLLDPLVKKFLLPAVLRLSMLGGSMALAPNETTPDQSYPSEGQIAQTKETLEREEAKPDRFGSQKAATDVPTGGTEKTKTLTSTIVNPNVTPPGETNRTASSPPREATSALARAGVRR